MSGRSCDGLPPRDDTRRHRHIDYETIEVTPLAPRIGGEVTGVDLTRPLSSKQVEDLQRALNDWLVIFFRDQRIGYDDHRRLADYFGGPHIAPSGAPRRIPGVGPEVMRIHADADSTYVAGEDWHTDMSCDEAPPWVRSSTSTPCPNMAAIPSSPTCTLHMMCSRIV